MHKDAYHLINDCRSVQLEDAKEMAQVATNVHDSIIEGISAIGSIMFWAGDNENYCDDQAKKDMQKLGDMLTNISRLASGAKTAQENISYTLLRTQQ
jgi:hypothetical protein